MTENKSFDIAKAGGLVTAVMAAFAAAGAVFAGPFGAALGAGAGAIIAGIAIIVKAVKSRNKQKRLPENGGAAGNNKN